MIPSSTLLGFACALLAIGQTARLLAADGKPKVLDLNQVDVEEVEDQWENRSTVPKVNIDNGLKVKDIVETSSDYTYASFGKADPFSMPGNLMAPVTTETPGGTGAEAGAQGGQVKGTSPSGREITVTSALQAYPLDSLEVKGVWQTAEGEFRAIIQTPKQEGIVVRDGDPIASGKIMNISKEKIKVRLYKLRKDGVREYEDSDMTFGFNVSTNRGTIKLEPGKDAQFPGMESPADEVKDKKGDAAAAQTPPATPPAPTRPPPPGFVNPDLKGQNAAAPVAGGAAAVPAAGGAPPPANAPNAGATPVSTRPGASN